MRKLRLNNFFSAKGFSLIETILIMATLGALATATYIGFADNKEIGAHKEVSKKLKNLKEIVLEYSKKGRYPCPAAPLPKSNPKFLQEAIDETTGYCDEKSLYSYDADGITNYGNGYTAPKADFVMGLFPCSGVGESEDCGQNPITGNYFGYAVSNHKAKKDGCDSFGNPDGTITKLPVNFGVVTDWDFNLSAEENIKKYTDSSIIAEFYIIDFGNSIGSWTKNGDRINPTIVKEKNNKIKYLNYNEALNVNTDFDLKTQLDDKILIPSKPLSIPSQNLTKDDVDAVSNTNKTFADIVGYGKSDAITGKICVSCKACDKDSSAAIVKVDSFNSCLGVANACKCSNTNQCDATAGECCEVSTGKCGVALCSASCTQNSDCPGSECCQLINGNNGTCSASFCPTNPKCNSDTDCSNGECCSVAKQECSVAYCDAYPNCCSTDSCCDSRCSGHDKADCACAADPCSDTSCTSYDPCVCDPSGVACQCQLNSCASPSCPGYNLCTCNPSDPSCTTSCSKDSDCGNGECCSGGICTTNCPNTCKKNNDCANGICCVGGLCNTTCQKPCNNNNACASGECCENNVCTTSCPNTCQKNNDCANGDCCLGNICVTCPPSSCNNDGDCPSGECCNKKICGSCTKQSCCSTDSCCDSKCKDFNALVCVACSANSCTDATCPSYDFCTCNPADPSCAPPPTSGCTSNSDCSSGNCCVANACVACPPTGGCTANGDCASGQCCNSGTCGTCSSSSGGEPQCCSTDSCCNASCNSYDTCTCNPADPICGNQQCLVDADCKPGECCLSGACTTNCNNPPPPPTQCTDKSDCSPTQGCCNGVCFNISAMTNGQCPTLACNPTSNPCPKGYVCCGGFCEEAKIDILGKVTGIGYTVAKGGGTVQIPVDTSTSSTSSGSSTSSSGSSSKGSGGGASSSSSSTTSSTSSTSSSGSGSSSSSIDIVITASDICNTCQSSADCGGQNCCNGFCSATPCQTTCSTGADCDPAVPFCCNGICQAAACSCSNNSQCSGATPYCCSGSCQAAPCSCSNNNQCPSGQNCCNGQCQSTPCSCSNNSQCSGDKPYCCNGKCQAQNCCTNNSQCQSGQCCNTLNGQCHADYCPPSCCSTDSCCSQNCPGYNGLECGCSQDPCFSSLCDGYNICTCDPASCPSSSSTSSSSSGGGNGCPTQCNSYTVGSWNCPNGCGAQGSITWENYANSNTVSPEYIFDLNISEGGVIASGTTDGLDWQFIFIYIQTDQCPYCSKSLLCGFKILNTCDVLTQADPGNGGYIFPVTCKFGVDYSQATIEDTSITIGGGNNEYCSLAVKLKRRPAESSFWQTRSTVGCSGSSSSGCGTLDGYCRNSFDPYPASPLMCISAP